MKIIKILNNNTALVDDAGAEKVAMGKGIAFGKKTGDLLDAAKVEKSYGLSGEATDDLLSSLDPKLLSISDHIITLAEASLTTKISDLAFVAIADHLSGAIVRQKAGTPVKNFLLWDVKRFFPREFEVGKVGLELVKREFDVDLTEDEAGFIALHIVNAGLDGNSADASNLTKLMEEILTVIKYSRQISFDEENIYFQRFMTHLKFFAERILQKSASAKSSSDNEMLELMSSKYPESYDAVVKICDFIETQYDYAVPADEKLYLTIHLTRIL